MKTEKIIGIGLASLFSGISGLIGFKLGRKKTRYEARTAEEMKIHDNLLKSHELLKNMEDDSMSVIVIPDSEDEQMIIDSMEEFTGEVNCQLGELYGVDYNRYIFDEPNDIILIRKKLY